MISPILEQLLNVAIKRANTLKHEYLTLENVLLAILDDESVIKIFGNLEIETSRLKEDVSSFIKDDENHSILDKEDIEELSKSQFGNEELRKIARENGIEYQPEITHTLQRVIQRAALHVQSSNKKAILPHHLLISMYNEQDSHAVYFLKKNGVERFALVNHIAHKLDKPVRNGARSTRFDPLEDEGQETGSEVNVLEEYCVNLNTRALEGKIDPIIGRQEELERVIQVLSRRRKNNPILVGESGVGKTAIAEGLALMVVSGNVPESLKTMEIYSADMASILAGTKFRGDFEERFKRILTALEKKNEKDGALLFIDEIHTVIGAGSTSGGSMDASNLLKPALGRGTIRCMGSTTYDEYRKFFEKDQALTRRFQKVDIVEPNFDDTVEILDGVKEHFEKFHNVEFKSDLMKDVVKLTTQYIHDRKLPDKAIDVLDETGAYLSILHETKTKETPHLVNKEDIEKIIAKIARIPEKQVSSSEKDKLKNLERDLRMLIFGQDEAVKKVSETLLLSRSGLSDELKPIGSFLFVGPTGVGKTELAKQLAYLMGINFERIDMSEYMEKHSVAKLIGAPPGYVGFDQGGILTEKINKQPYSVLLLDEIEKAHPDVFNILLQIMDHGKLSDSNGKEINFRNTILIMTSNAGAKQMDSGSVGFGGSKGQNQFKRDKVIKEFFSPEFRNRLDAIINFNSLGTENISHIVDKFIIALETALEEKNVSIEVSKDVREYLAKVGFDSKLGARPIQRAVNENLRKKLANELLFGDLVDGGNVEFFLDNDEIQYKVVEKK